MKPHFHLVPRSSEFGYLARQHTLPNFGTVWHYHPELELHYIIRGEGVRFVGENISNFDSGELLLLGANLPHMWRCNEAYFTGDRSISAEAIVVHFLPDFAGADLLLKGEATPLLALYEKARLGQEIFGETKKKVLALMKQAVKRDRFKRLITILQIVDILMESVEMKAVNAETIIYPTNSHEIKRLNKIYNYALENYREDISLEDVAGIANLSVTSFCRYFKMMTKKTFNDFLLEIRISHARRLLIQDEQMTTHSICFECGFNTRSNFFKQFKKVTGYSPAMYKERFLKLY